jgi:uncharacterized protein
MKFFCMEPEAKSLGSISKNKIISLFLGTATFSRRFRMILVVTVYLLLFFLSPVLAAEPNFPNYSGFVNDYANVLDQPAKDKLEGLCRNLEQKTGAELAIAIVKTVEPLDSKTYAVKLFEKWKIGKKGKDNGVLVLMAMTERRIEIEVGYGLEGVINDAKAGAILDKYVIPSFKQGDFAAGLSNCSEALAGEIAAAAKVELGDEYQDYKKTAGSDSDELDWGWIAALIAAMIFLSIFRTGWASAIIGGIAGIYFGYGWGSLVGAGIGGIIGAIFAFLLLPVFMSGGGGGGLFSGGFGGGSFGGGGGGFGGFGGGGSGGGGSGRSW